MISFLQKIFGDHNKKEITKLQPIITKIHTLDEEWKALSEEDLLAKMPEFKERIHEYVKVQLENVNTLAANLEKDEVVADPELKKEMKTRYERECEKLNDQYQKILDEILPEVFAVIKNACRRLQGRSYPVRGVERTWEIVPFDVQLIGGIVLHGGTIAEMKTGEGKTFVAALPIILNALTGRGVHLVTVNDYLAQRDAEWMGFLYNYLGFSVGVIINSMGLAEKKEAYAADITYGTNNEFGFDYLRDNMAVDGSQVVQRPLNFAIVDEVDSILIDEARTPLIISAPADESTDKYYQYSVLVGKLVETTHYTIDEKLKTASLTEEGIRKMESLLGVENVYTEAGFREVHHMEQALKARACYKRDIDYVVKEGEIVIIDEFTGRMLSGRRYSEGLHQAIEAKEGVEVKRESMTLATITFQNYFRLYNKLSGMTGTAMTEAEEFGKIYKLEVITIPTNRPVTRNDRPDAIFATMKGKFQAVVNVVKEKHALGQPVLIGTISIERSEMLSVMLEQEGIPHTVLNAKFHEQEAEIIAGAGAKNAVTIATNMAGRGTDIKLGEGVVEVGGLSIIGTERHESRRIDNQLRGRSGRQGDPGDTQFYVSMDDDLMRIFGGERMKSLMLSLKVPEDVPIENSLISKQIEQAQKRVENHHFDTREHVVKYDDVMNRHREIIYSRRRRILTHTNLKAEITELNKELARDIVMRYTSTPNHADWDFKGIAETTFTYFHDEDMKIEEADLENYFAREELIDRIEEYLLKAYDIRESVIPEQGFMRKIERSVYLRAIDVLWMEHLENMQYLRTGVAMRGVGQRDPLVEYKHEAFIIFEKLLKDISANVISTLFHMDLSVFTQQPYTQQEVADEVDPEAPAVIITNRNAIGGELYGGEVDMADVQRKQVEVIEGKTSYKVKEKKEPERNDPCPCGSGKKYKKCHGA